MEIGTRLAHSVFRDHLSHHEGAVTVGDDGWAELYCDAGSVSVWAKA
ncbi:alpha-amylase domain-containing protein [Pedobacter frigidisoli]